MSILLVVLGILCLLPAAYVALLLMFWGLFTLLSSNRGEGAVIYGGIVLSTLAGAWLIYRGVT